jgi:phosphoglycolate phosphatase
MSENIKKIPELIIFDWEGTLGRSSNGLISGVKETLQVLKDHKILLAIATSMSFARLKELITEYELSDFFVHLQSSEMGYPKPDPQMLLAVLEATNCSAESAVMVGDCSYDLTMAAEAHVAAIGVLTGSDSEERLTSASDDVVVLDSVNELPRYYALGS